MPLFRHAMPRALARHSEPIELARKAGCEVGDVDHLLHFALSFGNYLSHFECHERTEIGFCLSQRIPDLAHNFAALRGRKHPPALEDLLRLRDHAIVLASRRETNAREFGAVRRIQRRYGRRTLARHPLARVRARIFRLDSPPFLDRVARYLASHRNASRPVAKRRPALVTTVR